MEYTKKESVLARANTDQVLHQDKQGGKSSGGDKTLNKNLFL
jgi:hypothetical protein